MDGQSLFVGYRASTSNRFCNLCGGPVESHSLLCLVTLIDRPRACCDNCGRTLAPELNEMLRTLRGKASTTLQDLLDMKPGPDGLAMVREYVRLVEPEAVEAEEVQPQWLPLAEVVGM